MNRRRQLGLLLATVGLGWLASARVAARRRRTIDLHGRTVLITGGSRGLGLVLARELTRHGAALALCARDEDELERARTELSALGATVFTFPCDVTDRASVREMVRVVRHHYGRIDVLINNAGTIAVGPLETMTLEDYEEAMRTHFWGALHTIDAVLPEMRARREGRIVNVTSIGGKISVPHLLPYGASKFAAVGLSEGLRAELAKDGVLVTTVCPGLMRTGSPTNASFKGRHWAEYTWFSIASGLPLVSISAERAARRIIEACRRGEAEVFFPLSAALAARIHGLWPGLTADLLAALNRLLPVAEGGVGTAPVKGRHSTTFLSPSWLTTLTDRAAARNNELA
ncbi:MAG TPA: SDR family NAD(P)-dependent oxidoreductase [Gemmatimonadales bacterium]|nr:SDR family NAD(P)-dependent oxidoreductase [Gemmatimonadales bacterium]